MGPPPTVLRIVLARVGVAVLLACTWAFPRVAAAQPAADALEAAPPPLRAWVPWVLHGSEKELCPVVDRERRCAWPTSLTLEASADGARFVQTVWAARRTAVELPGDPETWPREVTLDGLPALLLDRGDVPTAQVPAGWSQLSGRFAWDRLPDALAVPDGVALVELRVQGQARDEIRRDESGRLWLAQSARREESGEADRVHIEVFRKLIEDVPIRVETRLRLRVSGDPREVSLGRVGLDGFEPLALESALPASLDDDGALRIQLRAGDWLVSLTSRSSGPVESVAPPERGAPWPAAETWSYEADADIRSVRVEGVEPVDPARANVPEAWRNYPSYHVRPDRPLQLVELRRGLGEPGPDSMDLRRTMWLHPGGATIRVRDELTVSARTGGRLELLPPGELTRATVDGEPRVITRTEGAAGEGVEIRRGEVTLEGHATYARDGSPLPVVGWNRDAQHVTAELQLPPGWRLIAAPGADSAVGAWLDSWTLLDLFLVLVLLLALWRLLGPAWSLIGLVGAALAWHEPGAPRTLWYVLLVCLALVRALPSGKLLGATRALGLALGFFLAMQLTVFTAEQTRVALFPQLEFGAVSPLSSYVGKRRRVPMPLALGDMMMQTEGARAPSAGGGAELEDVAEEAVRSRAALSAPMEQARSNERALATTSSVDPNAVVQTGPGLPDWNWRHHTLRWTGPATTADELRLVLTGPIASGVLGILRVLLLIALAAGLFLAFRRARTAPSRRRRAMSSGSSQAAVFALLCGGAVAFGGGAAEAQAPSTSDRSALRQTGFPPSDMLQELKARLLAPPDCAPSCVEVEAIELQIVGAELTVRATVHAAAPSAWAVPGPESAWRPVAVRTSSDRELPIRRGSDRMLSVLLDEGIQQVEARGPIADGTTLQFAEPPRRLTLRSEGWIAEGLRAGQPPPASIRLVRVPTDGSNEEVRDQVEDDSRRVRAEIEPWFIVERRLEIGLPWLVSTTVRRVDPGAGTAIVAVPVLDGERVTSGDVAVEDGRALVSFGPGIDERHWMSTLEPRAELTLTAQESSAWFETWVMWCTRLWRCDAAGMPPVERMVELGDGQVAQWLPRWRPWPGESLTLTFSEPAPVEGATTTIERIDYSASPGRRLLEAEVSASLSSSSGGELALDVPEAAEIRSVRVNGNDRPWERRDGRVVLPIEPGEPSVHLGWALPKDASVRYELPPLTASAPIANYSVSMELPRSRWVIWAYGGQWGPVVTIWQYLVALLLLAWILARVVPSPLRFSTWFLLGLGLTQIPVAAGAVLVAWFAAFGLRGRGRQLSAGTHNFLQLVLVGLTFAAAAVLVAALVEGLALRPPDLGIDGAGSGRHTLNWYASGLAEAPRVGVIWLPLWVWNVTMLAWSAWLAIRVVGWTRWGWGQFRVGGLWRGPTTKSELGASSSRGDASVPPSGGEVSAGEQGGRDDVGADETRGGVEPDERDLPDS